MQKHEGKRFSAKDYLFSELRKLTNNSNKDGRSRSRSIFTSHHGNIVDERCGRDIKFLSGSSSVPNTSASSSWLPRGIYKGFYDEAPFANTFPVADNWRDADLVETTKYGAGVTSNGIISLRLHDKIRIDMTLDRALRIVNRKNNIVIAISSTGSSAALLHPNGRVYQYGSRVEILAYDPHGNNKFAKMWYKGVSFTSVQCALVYLVDSAGTRTTTDTFSDLLNQDYSMQVFYTDARYGQNHVQEALSVLQGCHYWVSEDMTDNWIINNVRISQTSDGLVRVFYSLGRNSNKFTLRTSPTNGSASLSSPFLHCTGSMGQTRHLFVRRGERRMHYDGTSFIVRNAGHSAGFDDKHQLKVY